MAAEVRIEFNQGWERKIDMRPAYNRLGPSISEQAKRMAPVDTGELRGSIGWTIRPENGVSMLYLYASAPHAVFVELGTRFMRAQPYLRPAAFQRWS